MVSRFKRYVSLCQDFHVDHAYYQEYSGHAAYGYNETFSGLAFLPLEQTRSMEFQRGILPGLLYIHDSTVEVMQ
jgi:hypothetical protein